MQRDDVLYAGHDEMANPQLDAGIVQSQALILSLGSSISRTAEAGSLKEENPMGWRQAHLTTSLSCNLSQSHQGRRLRGKAR